MGYVQESLMPGETVVYSTKLNGLRLFLPSSIWFGLGLLMIATSPSHNTGYLVAGLAGLFLLKGFIERSQSEFAVTNKRVIIKAGLIKRRSLDILVSKVESVGLQQSIMDRMFGCGTIVVNGSGNTNQAFSKLEKPSEFRKQVQIQISNRDAA